MARPVDEQARAMIHDLMIAILEGRETTEHEPVPRSIGVVTFNRAIREAIAQHKAAKADKR